MVSTPLSSSSHLYWLVGPPQLLDARSIGLGGVVPPMCMWCTVWLAGLCDFRIFCSVGVHSGCLLKSQKLLVLMKKSTCRSLRSRNSTSLRVHSPSPKFVKAYPSL